MGTLAYIKNIIDKELKKDLTIRERNLLISFRNRALNIMTEYRECLHHSPIEYAIQQGNIYTQDHISKIYVEKRNQAIKVAKKKLERLLHDVSIEYKKAQFDLNHKNTFTKIAWALSDIEFHIGATLKNIDSKYTLDNKIIDRKFFAFYFASVMQGRYLPFSQGSDPFRDEHSKGECFGYVKAWSNEVSQYGHSINLHCLDDEVNDIQSNQLGYGSIGGTMFDFHADTDFRTLLNNILDHIQPEKIYNLQLSFSISEGHAIGLRYIADSKEYEFFDPNLGTFVFGNRENFVAFLSLCLLYTYFVALTKNGLVSGFISLQETGIQPVHAKPSVPETTKLRSDHKNDDYIYSLSEIAKDHETELSDASYIRRHWPSIVAGGLLGLIGNLSTVLSYLLIARKSISLSTFGLMLAVCEAAGLAIECNSNYISSTLVAAAWNTAVYLIPEIAMLKDEDINTNNLSSSEFNPRLFQSAKHPREEEDDANLRHVRPHIANPEA